MKKLLITLLLLIPLMGITKHTPEKREVTIRCVAHCGNGVSIAWTDVFGTHHKQYVQSCLVINTWYWAGNDIKIAYKGMYDKVHVVVEVEGREVYYQTSEQGQMTIDKIKVQ